MLDRPANPDYSFFGIHLARLEARPVAERTQTMPPSPLFKEIVVVLAVKAALLFGLWAAFFSNPVDDDLAAGQVGDTLFGGKEARRNQVDKGEADGR